MRVFPSKILATSIAPFGMVMKERSWQATSTDKYRFGFNGKEKDDEVSLEGGSYDFGERIYDGRLGRFLSLDRFAFKYPFYSPYLFAGNNPIAAIDIDGDSLYILFHVNSYDDKADNEMFYAAALTRKTDIERSKHFDPKKDKVVVIGISDVSDIKAQTENTVNENSKTYGKTQEVGVWSHAGLNGPVGSEPTTNSPLFEGSNQMELAGWGDINFNWANKGEGCIAGFYGCKTGVNPKGEEISFSTSVSDLANFENVTVLGQTSSSFPSKYVNFRENSESGDGNFVDGKEKGKIVFRRTYMVGGVRSRNDLNGNEQNKALPLRKSKNGVGKTDGYQSGDKKVGN
jgi:RHS repeat-associated protein